MTSQATLRSAVIALLMHGSLAFPISSHLSKRQMSTGARAGLGVGIAVAVLLVVLIIVFFIVHMRRRTHNAALNDERAILAGEKYADGRVKTDKFAPASEQTAATSAFPKRSKSVKDRLMGPLYRGSTIDLMPLPKAKLSGNNNNRQSTMTTDAHWDNIDGQPFLHKPWSHGDSSPRPSFSSKRATRMMMMM